MSDPTPAPRTLVTFLLDRTGSMQSIKDDTIGAFNAYLSGLQKNGDLIDFTFLQFDSQSLDKIHVKTPVGEVRPLTDDAYQPRAATPLIDAAYKTIKAVEGSLTSPANETKVVICIQTDGQENASVEHSWADLNLLIKAKTDAGWQFNFLGCGIDAYAQGARMGISAQSTMSYERHDTVATRAAFAASASNTADFSAGRVATTSYSVEQRRAAKDAHWDRQRAGGGTAPPVPTPPKNTAPAKGIVDNIRL